MIYLTGDTHGSYRHVRRFVAEHDVGPADVLICLGDTGFDYFNDERDAQIKDKAEHMGITLLCIRGNHDRNPASLPSYHLIPWRGGEVYCDDRWPSILFARDGSVFDLDGRTAVAIGGAYSVDKAYRLAKGYAWYPDEQLMRSSKRSLPTTGVSTPCSRTPAPRRSCPKRRSLPASIKAPSTPLWRTGSKPSRIASTTADGTAATST